MGVGQLKPHLSIRHSALLQLNLLNSNKQRLIPSPELSPLRPSCLVGSHKNTQGAVCNNARLSTVSRWVIRRQQKRKIILLGGSGGENIHFLNWLPHMTRLPNRFAKYFWCKTGQCESRLNMIFFILTCFSSKVFPQLQSLTTDI